MAKEFRPLFRTGKVNARVRKKGNGYEVRCQVDGERISVYGKLLYEAKAKFIVKLAELRSPSRPRKRNSVLLDKKNYIFLAKRVTPGQLKRNFSTFREENSRPLRGHKEKQPHKHMRLLSLSIWLAKSGQYFDTFFFQHFFIHNAVAAVSRKAVKHIYNYVSERSAFCIRNHSLKSRAASFVSVRALSE